MERELVAAGCGAPLAAAADTRSAAHVRLPMIAFRKQHLGRYPARLDSGDCDAKMVDCLDMVDEIHMPEAGRGRPCAAGRPRA